MPETSRENLPTTKISARTKPVGTEVSVVRCSTKPANKTGLVAEENDGSATRLPDAKFSGFDQATQDLMCSTIMKSTQWEKSVKDSSLDLGARFLTLSELMERHFIAWIKSECPLSVSTVENLMRVAREFESKNVNFTNLPLSACYEVTAKSVPPAAKAEILAKSALGPLKLAEVRTIIRAHKGARNLESKARDLDAAKAFFKELVEVGFSAKRIKELIAPFADITFRTFVDQDGFKL